jgi:hypothetical protein
MSEAAIRVVTGSALKFYDQTFSVGKITDELADRWRKAADEGWGCDDVLASSQRRVLNQVDHLNLIAPVQMPFAQPL